MCNRAEIRKTPSAAAFILALLFSVIVETQLVNLGNASTKPTTIIIISPEDNKTFGTNNVTLSVDVSMIEPFKIDGKSAYNFIIRVDYEADWLEGSGYIFHHLEGELFGDFLPGEKFFLLGFVAADVVGLEKDVWFTLLNSDQIDSLNQPLISEK